LPKQASQPVATVLASAGVDKRLGARIRQADRII
jgi:hypothetical protein